MTESLFDHACVIYIDQWQNEDLGSIKVSDESIEFWGTQHHIFFKIMDIVEVKRELDLIKLYKEKEKVYMFKFLKKPPYKKGWLLRRLHYDHDEESEKKFVQVVSNLIIKVRGRPSIKEREIIKELVMVQCNYCGGLMPQSATFCPNCGAKKI